MHNNITVCPHSKEILTAADAEGEAAAIPQNLGGMIVHDYWTIIEL